MLRNCWCGQKFVVYLDTAICFIVLNISKLSPSSLDALQNIITLSVTFSGDLTAGYFLLVKMPVLYNTNDLPQSLTSLFQPVMLPHAHSHLYCLFLSLAFHTQHQRKA